MDDFSINNPEYVWLSIAALLALAELFVPGVFLIWVAAAAAVTGVLSLFIDMTFAGQLTVFGLSTIAAVLGGRRWYLTHNVKSESPLLNNRSAQLVGRTVTVVEAISSTSGRVKVADGEWKAKGPNMEKGTVARVAAVEGGVLRLEALEDTAILESKPIS
ncbi:NfeD family protein [Parasphingorhabdus flavimaris]|uniref:NfeD family protein n=1 Tax=Parasphingorhabdus flavimaris TaxID=266812 RepID=A0ABX2N113_9SPHN|nr:NfeD family protein [Parasphingorhabdus flavimaris]NVD27384.1 NfeD family protein [Parasphingorhabdus flavimaris]|tara:strand:+ start:13789 stop:14268 length:480 start_codon:yes stop_codon:yes gene_type:complete